MTTRRSFMGLLGCCVLAVSTSIPVLNRDPVTPNRPPTVEVVQCEKCGWVPSGTVVKPGGDWSNVSALKARLEAQVVSGDCFSCHVQKSINGRPSTIKIVDYGDTTVTLGYAR